MMEHTKEPWELRTALHGHFNEKCLSIVQAGHQQFELLECIAIVDPVLLAGPLQTANARRIVACVNACAGIPTEYLQSCPHDHLYNGVKVITDLIQQRDKLLAALTDIMEYHGPGTLPDELFEMRVTAIIEATK